MPLLCVQMTWTCSIDTFLFNVSERGEPPVGGIRILVQDDYEVIAFPDVGQPEVRVEHGGAKRNESKELVVPVSWLAAACLRTQPFNRKDKEQQHPELSYHDVGITRPVVKASRETLLNRSV